MSDPRLTATSEQLAEIAALQERWLTDEQIAQYPDALIRATARDILKLCSHEGAPVFVVDTPVEAKRLAHLLEALDQTTSPARSDLPIFAQATNLAARLCEAGIVLPNIEPAIQTYLNANLDDTTWNQMELRHYCGLWWNVWMAWLEAGKIVGVTYDAEKYDLMQRFNQHCPIWMWCTRAVYVLRRPKTPIYFDDNDRLHNESGPAVTFGNDYHLWEIHGQIVDEQIVMRPETQTVKQINADTNNDRRAIRIERFGWGRYLKESRAKQLDARKNEVDGTYEVLYTTKRDGHRFVANCTTGRIISLGVPNEVTTCEGAQAWLAGPSPFNSLGRT